MARILQAGQTDGVITSCPERVKIVKAKKAFALFVFYLSGFDVQDVVVVASIHVTCF